MYRRGPYGDVLCEIKEGVAIGIGYIDKAEITPEFVTVAPSEIATFTLCWKQFDFNQGEYVINEENTNLFRVKIGEIIEEIEPTKGVVEFSVQSDVEGEFIIETINPYATPAIAKVVVKSA